MEQKKLGNNYDLNATWRFFKRWKKLLISVAVVAFIVSLIASLLVTPRYKATAILFPTSSNRLSKAILADRYSMDFMDYGIERDCEYAIQILSSQSMEDDVCAHFNMMEHYGINPKDKHKMFKMHEMYRGNVSVKRTEYLGVEVNVLDVDAKWAADVANYIAANYDTLSNRIQQARAQNSYDIMKGVCTDIQQDIYAYEDSLSINPAHAASIRELIGRKCKELAAMQSRMSETKVDLNQQVSYKYWLDQAKPADKKAYPKRAIIVLLGTLGALAVCILTLLVVGRVKGKDDDPAPRGEKNAFRLADATPRRQERTVRNKAPSTAARQESGNEEDDTRRRHTMRRSRDDNQGSRSEAPSRTANAARSKEESAPRRDNKGTGNKETKDNKETKEPRESREPREPREPRESRDSREPRESRDSREPREPRDSREPRESRDSREPRESRDSREPREPRDSREPREPRDSREQREFRDPAVQAALQNRPKTDIAPNPPEPRIPKAPYNDAPSF